MPEIKRKVSVNGTTYVQLRGIKDHDGKPSQGWYREGHYGGRDGTILPDPKRYEEAAASYEQLAAENRERAKLAKALAEAVARLDREENAARTPLDAFIRKANHVQTRERGKVSWF